MTSVQARARLLRVLRRAQRASPRRGRKHVKADEGGRRHELWLPADFMTGLGAATAIGGCIAPASGVDELPLEWLSGTPFSSYRYPGAILTVVAGGSAAAGRRGVAGRALSPAVLPPAAFSSVAAVC